MNKGTIGSQSDAQLGMIVSLGGVVALLLGIYTFMVSETDSDWTFLWLAIVRFGHNYVICVDWN